MQSYNMWVIMGVVWSNPLYNINTSFSSCLNLKMNGITGKRSKNWPKKVVWIPIFGCMVFEILMFENLKKVLTQHFSWFSNLHISKNVHPNIVNHTSFLASFLSCFYWCHSFLDLSNLKAVFLYRNKGFHHTTPIL